MKSLHKIIILCAWAIIAAGGIWYYSSSQGKLERYKSNLVFADYSISDLAGYNGTDSAKPILLAYKGKVYDVTGGKKFYDVSGRYHSLAGRDSTKELNIVGGKIIEAKYPVVGNLISK